MWRDFRRGVDSLHLEPAPGRASLNLLKMARRGLAEEIRKAINQAEKKGSAQRKDVRFQHNGRGRSVNISVEQLNVGSVPEDVHYVVLFEEVASPSGWEDGADFQGCS